MELKSLGLAEWARMAASYLHLPSKSHRGIAKIFALVNSLQKIIVKLSSESKKTFSGIIATHIPTVASLFCQTKQPKTFLLQVKTITKSPEIGIAESVKACNVHQKGSFKA